MVALGLFASGCGGQTAGEPSVGTLDAAQPTLDGGTNYADVSLGSVDAGSDDVEDSSTGSWVCNAGCDCLSVDACAAVGCFLFYEGDIAICANIGVSVVPGPRCGDAGGYSASQCVHPGPPNGCGEPSEACCLP